MFLALLACTSDGGDSGLDPCDVGPDPSLRIGVGEVIFEELPEGPAELIHGPQGGYHVVLALEATHFDTNEQLVAELTGTVDGIELAHTEPFVTLRCNPAVPAQQVWNLFLILDDGVPPEDAHGVSMHVVATLDGADTSASAEADIEVRYPELE